MMDAIVVKNVSKRYPRNEPLQRTLRHEAILIARTLIRRSKQAIAGEPFLALRDVSFSITSGESVAIVGRNGSGKTTLLRILAGITRPTNGSVEVNGHYVALIGLGAGFRPELTGRQNIFPNSAINAVYFRHDDPVINDIIDFSELHDFIDLPVSRYSSGMVTRLAFSIAIHILSDIILIDEVLAVGDAAFRKKCMTRILNIKGSGHTIIFVSHDNATASSLCERTLWLHSGQLMADGPSPDVIREYEMFLNPTT